MLCRIAFFRTEATRALHIDIKYIPLQVNVCAQLSECMGGDLSFSDGFYLHVFFLLIVLVCEVQLPEVIHTKKNTSIISNKNAQSLMRYFYNLIDVCIWRGFHTWSTIYQIPDIQVHRGANSPLSIVNCTRSLTTTAAVCPQRRS